MTQRECKYGQCGNYTESPTRLCQTHCPDVAELIEAAIDLREYRNGNQGMQLIYILNDKRARLRAAIDKL